MARTSQPDPARQVIVGVDTHKYIHVAVAVDQHGARLGELSISADSKGYRQLHDWAQSHGRVGAYGVEGTGSYGVGLAKFLRRAGARVLEVNRADRRSRHQHGKSDPLDAESAARSVLNGTATNVPKSAEGICEMIREVKVARDGARKARSAALVALKSIVVNAPSELRESLTSLTTTALVLRCSNYRPGDVESVHASTKYTLRALARRWIALNEEIVEHNRLLERLTQHAAPTLREGFGIGPDTAAEMLIVFGDNPERVHSEAAFAKLCGVCPIPASSGLTNKHRLYRGGHRQANAALYRATVVRMQYHEPTIAYVNRRIQEGLTKKDVIRCLKRHLAREIYQRVMIDHRARMSLSEVV
jgi:transposase